MLRHYPLPRRIAAPIEVGISRAYHRTRQHGFDGRARRCAQVDAVVAFAVVGSAQRKRRKSEGLRDAVFVERPTEDAFPCGGYLGGIHILKVLRFKVAQRRLGSRLARYLFRQYLLVGRFLRFGLGEEFALCFFRRVERTLLRQKYFLLRK